MSKRAKTAIAVTPAESIAPVVATATTGEVESNMPCQSCPPPAPVVIDAPTAERIATAVTPAEGQVLMRYSGLYAAPVLYFGLYAGCTTCDDVAVDVGDVPRMLATGAWTLVEQEPAA